MAQSTVLRVTSLVILLAVTSSAKDQTRWSRQISSYTSDISDWVPLPGPVERDPPLPPIKRQAVAEPRILTEPFPGLPRPTGFNSDIFPARTYFNAPANRQLYLQSVPAVPSAPQNYLTDQGFGQSIRFGLSQPNFPLNQGFISPQFGYEGIPQNAPHTVSQIKSKPQIQPPVNPVKFDNFQKTPFQVPMSVPVKPFNSQLSKAIPEVPKFVDGYRAENSSVFSYNQKKKPQSLQKIKFESYEKPASVARPEVPVVPQSVQKPQQSNQKLEREEVQLLYVPLESLNRGQFNFRSSMTSPQILNSDVYSQGVPQVPYKKTVTELHRPVQKETTPNYFTEFNSQLHSQQQKEIDQVPKFSTLSSPFPTSPPTTPKPKKLKPHQPPLAIFLTEEAGKNHQIRVGDVLASLKTQNSVPVLDSINPLNAPKVFIGPSSLQAPERYVKFELPYLSNIENSDKKLRQLPFFVAPLSYNTPQGFAKIPFPSPHVGSVVINSQIKETTTHVPSTENVQPAYYTGTYKQEQQLPQKPATQKPTVSFYTTYSPKTVPQYQSNYYQFEPQTVSTIRPLKEPETVAPPRPGNYFLSNTETQYNTQFNGQYNPNQYQFVQESYETKPQPAPAKTYTAPKIETTTTPRPTSTTTKLPSTYPSQLLETHNPYSINQAFHFSTPLDYRTYTDTEYKEPAPAVATELQSTPQISVSTTRQPLKEEVVTEPQRYQPQTSPQYQSYTPEIHYESEVQNSRHPTYNTNDYPRTETPSYSSETYAVQNEKNQYNIPANSPTQYTENEESQTPGLNETPVEESKPTVTEVDNQQRYEYNQYETNFSSNEEQTSTTSTTTSTTTTTRRPLRGRGRPRYTTTPRTDSSEYYTRATRRPLRERKPLPTRSRYEPNKITTEKPTRKPVDYSEESTTKSSRTRTRGRVTYKPSEEIYDKRKAHNSKEQDLAYQRDVLHQNYPVTIQERHSTVDIEAMTEPTPKLSSNKDFEPATESYDTENAYTYERASIAQQTTSQESEDDIPVFPTKTTVSQTETSYVPRLSTRNEEYIFHSRSSAAPAQPVTYEEPRTEREEESYVKQTTPVQRELESVAYATEPTVFISEHKEEDSTYNNEETTTTSPEVEETKEVNPETEEEENVVQTTPSYNRVRVRPGVIKQYHQTSTESSKVKADRRRPVTYRPAFDRRRTTMRIDEIQQDLKTKQVNGRPENNDYRHPVYKPETSSESTSTQEVTTKRGAIRRRRPNYSYTTSSTEGSPVTRKNSYELKNRFRGRRPTTEKPTEKTEVQSESTTTTNRPLNSRYSHRPRLSERYSKKPEPQPTEETEDQDSNFSINRPTYTEPDSGKWSSKIASDSFKPYNPNNIVDDDKIATTERRSDQLEMDIITARNEYDDLLISVTPASNNRNNKKIPEIPPTLEALVEQSKVTKSDASDNMSTFESMLEEVMKSLEEQDEDEYSSNVMKHKGGEIGEIPPEKIISSGDAYTKTTSPVSQDATTVETPTADDSINYEEENDRTSRRRGFWKKVKVRPVATESIEAAESQYYTNTVNMLGQNMEKDSDKPKSTKKVTVTTYKPSIQLMKDLFGTDDVTGDDDDAVPTIEISKLNTSVDTDVRKENVESVTTETKETRTEKNEVSPGDFDMGTGSPDPTMDNLYSTEPTTVKAEKQSFSFMDYLFGSTSEDETPVAKNETTSLEIEIATEPAKPKPPTTENTFMPEEITENFDEMTEYVDELKKVSTTVKEPMQKVSTTVKEPMQEVSTTVKDPLQEVTTTTEKPKTETTSQSSFMNPANVVSTSVSTEISHETEICFRGKCIKTFKQVV